MQFLVNIYKEKKQTTLKQKKQQQQQQKTKNSSITSTSVKTRNNGRLYWCQSRNLFKQTTVGSKKLKVRN